MLVVVRSRCLPYAFRRHDPRGRSERDDQGAPGCGAGVCVYRFCGGDSDGGSGGGRAGWVKHERMIAQGGCHLACHKTISFVFVYLLMNSNNMVSKQTITHTHIRGVTPPNTHTHELTSLKHTHTHPYDELHSVAQEFSIAVSKMTKVCMLARARTRAKAEGINFFTYVSVAGVCVCVCVPVYKCVCSSCPRCSGAH